MKSIFFAIAVLCVSLINIGYAADVQIDPYPNYRPYYRGPSYRGPYYRGPSINIDTWRFGIEINPNYGPYYRPYDPYYKPYKPYKPYNSKPYNSKPYNGNRGPNRNR